jgi:hypothetical protein
MSTELLLKYSMIAVSLLSMGVIGFIWHKKLVREFAFLVAFLCALCVEDTVSVVTLFFRAYVGLSKLAAYNIYFYSHQVSFFLEYALLVTVIYSVFRKAMKPLEGLHRAGKIVFRWVCGVSLALSFAMAVGPHIKGANQIGTITGQVQQGTSILILCLLLFVCFSTRHLGLTYRSHIFGVTLGLGVYATTSLVEAAWYTTGSAVSLYSPIYLFSSLGACLAVLTWGAYFAMPEPERKMILLPTTSPFFLWNRISEALGDEPGFVAIAGFKPEMLAPAELTVFTAASRRAQARVVEEELAEREAEAAHSAQQQAMSMQPIAMPR